MTKRYFTMAALLLVAHSLLGQTSQADSLPVTSIVWDTLFFDFGVVKEGKIIQQDYHFRNAGPGPLVISKVRTSCGCTVSEWPKDTIAPGQTGSVMVRFNTSKKMGRQLKIISVYANSEPPETRLQMGGEVKPAKRKQRAKG